ncbi:MAG: 6-phosphofructokinase [Bacilli bacterium]|nr:6-phosphofructokinase [Bacilli bacterium]
MIETSCIIAQSGGPTAVINSSLLGVIDAAKKMNMKHIYGALNGIDGILNERIIDLKEESETELGYLKNTPSAALGSVRFHLKDYKTDPATYEKIYEVFKKLNIHYFFYIGGNDSMDTCHKVAEYFKQHSYDCKVIGIPKTIDNDLMGTDHTPGYGSSVKYVVNVLSEIYLDTHAYKKGRVTVVEIMGRNAGWLTASSVLTKVSNTPVDLIYVPEAPFDINQFLDKVKRIYDEKQKVLVAVSEGIKTKDGEYFLKSHMSNKTDSFGHMQLGGVGQVLSEIVSEKLSLPVRAIELNLPQRSSSHIASATDIEEAYNCGVYALNEAVKGETGKMVVMKRVGDYQIEYSLSDISKIANEVKMVPNEYITDELDYITDEFINYALPLIQGDITIPYENGIVRFARLKKDLIKL